MASLLGVVKTLTNPAHNQGLKLKQLPKLFLLVQILLVCVSADIDILYRKDVCDEKEFYSPYVRLLRTRQPCHENHPMVKLMKPGYISLTKYTGVLCINGPAIVYTDVHKDPKCGADGWIPSYGEPAIYSHDCFSINRLSRDAYKRSDPQELSKDSHVFGNKVFGVYLIGMSPDYRLPSFVFYTGPNYGYMPDNSWCVHNGASVAFVANSSETSAHCYTVKKFNMEGIISTTYPGNPQFCYREDHDDDIDTPWRKGEPPLTKAEIKWDEEGIPCGPAPSVGGDMELDPVQLPDFRMIHPKFWSNQGSKGIMYKAKKKLGEMNDEETVYSRPNPPGSLFPGEPGWKEYPGPGISHIAPGVAQQTGLPEEGDGDIDATTMEPLQKFQAKIAESDCEEVPTPAESCVQEFGDPCPFINHVLTLEETDWKSDEMKDGSWRLPIINLVNEVYEKACPQVAKYLPSALSRVYQVFLKESLKNVTFKEKFNKPHKHEWSEMIMDLERCSDKAEMMTFYKKKNEAAIKYRTKLDMKLSQLYESVYARRETASRATDEMANSDSTDSVAKSSTTEEAGDSSYMEELQEIEQIRSHLNELPLKFPYKIYVGTSDSPDFEKASQIYTYREAAEIDHELDWALDSYWKVISTVLGYCSMHYSSRDSSTFMRLYDSFTEDFLDYIQEAWIKGDNRQIYDQLFGEFIYGPGTLWIDACQNGAYQWSETMDLRPLRPLPLLEGDLPPGPVAEAGAERPPPSNFFVDNPVFAKMTTDHFDYEDDGGGSDDSIPEPFLSSGGIRKNGIKTEIMDAILDPMHHFV